MFDELIKEWRKKATEIKKKREKERRESEVANISGRSVIFMVESDTLYACANELEKLVKKERAKCR